MKDNVIIVLAFSLAIVIAISICEYQRIGQLTPKEKAGDDLSFGWTDWSSPMCSIEGTNHTEWAQWRTNFLNHYQEYHLCKQQP